MYRMNIFRHLNEHPAAQANATRDEYIKKTRNSMRNLKMFCTPSGQFGMSLGYKTGELVLHPWLDRIVTSYDGPFCLTSNGVASCAFSNSPLDCDPPLTVSEPDYFKRQKAIKKIVKKLNTIVPLPHLATASQYWDVGFAWAKRDFKYERRLKQKSLHALSLYTNELPSQLAAIKKYMKMQTNHFWDCIDEVLADLALTGHKAKSEPTLDWLEKTLEEIVLDNMWDWLSLHYREREVKRRLRIKLFIRKINQS